LTKVEAFALERLSRGETGLRPDFGAPPLYIQQQTTPDEAFGIRICEPDDSLSTVGFDPERNFEVTYVEFAGIEDVGFVVGFSQIETCWRLSLVKGSRVHPPHRSRSCSPAS
jgi:hypothetical protein